jgi:uncharacterized protein YjbI with pentapeptide repeats
MLSRTVETGAEPPAPISTLSNEWSARTIEAPLPTATDLPYAPPPEAALPEVPAPPTTPAARPPRAIGDPLPIEHATKFAPFNLGWRLRQDRDAIVVVIKATAKIVANDAAQIVDADLPSGDVLSADAEPASLRYPSDFSIFKPRADVMLVGDAHVPAGVQVTRVQMRVGKHSWELAVIGDRHWDGSVPSSPQAFKTMPLTWERALGGTLSADNPVGRGYKTGTLLPNLERLGQLVTSKRDTPRPVCFAPISPKWRARASKLGKYDKSWLETRWPFFPADFDYAYFNAAPIEQQVPYLAGDETFHVTGVQPNGGVLEGRLPGKRPHVFALKSAAAGGELLALQMNLDTLLIDANGKTLTLVWRGLLEVADREALDLDAIYVEEGPLGPSTGLDRALARFLALTSKPSIDVAATLPANEEIPATDAPDTELEEAKRARRPLPGPPSVDAPKVPTKKPKVVKVPRDTIQQWLNEERSLKEVDLSGADLRDFDLRGRDLRGAILIGAQLDGARLDEANCAGMMASEISAARSSWTRADLTKSDLTDARLDGADFSEANLSQCVAQRAIAVGAKFDQVRAPGASLVNANLENASFDGARLGKADFTGASLRGARFSKAKMADAKFYEASGERVVLDDADLRDFRCEGGKLAQVSALRVAARGSVWDKSDVTDGTFEGADLGDASFVSIVATRTIFNKIVAPQATFRGALLQKACFLRADLTKASFEQADLTNADLRGATLDHAETWEANITGVDLRQASLVGSKLERGGGT